MTTPAGPTNEDDPGANTSGLDSGSAEASVDRGVEHTLSLGECSDEAQSTAAQVAESEAIHEQGSLIAAKASMQGLPDTNASATDPPPAVVAGATETNTPRAPAASSGTGKVIWKWVRDHKQINLFVGIVAAVCAIVAGVFQVLDYFKDDPPTTVSIPLTGPGVGEPVELDKPLDDKCTRYAANETCLEVKSIGSTEPRGSAVDTAPNAGLAVRVKYKNLGSAQVDGVILKLTVPDQYLSYLEGSTRIWNSKVPSGSPVSSEDLAKGGVNVGSYAPGGSVWLEQVYLVRDVSQFVCGINALVISAVAYVNESYKQDAVTVRVNAKEC